jgi:hypothetical protein
MRTEERCFIAIEREPRYSPQQHRQNDVAILGEAAAALVDLGWTGAMATESNVERGELPPADLYLNMCQGAAASRRLLALEQNGALLLNRPSSVLSCHRHRLVRALARAGVPFPATRIITTAGPPPAPGDLSDLAATQNLLWVKRGDVHAEAPNDVIAVSPHSVPAAGAAFAARGIERVAIQRHVPGRVVKFYAIANGAFFRWYDPVDASPTPVTTADEPALRALALRAGAVLGVEIFGGDIVLSTHGAPMLIDLNDWPSFATCRTEAAHAIALYASRIAGLAQPVANAFRARYQHDDRARAL